MRFEEYLDRYGTLTYTNVGVSMLPMLRQGRDLMIVQKRPPGRLKKYDVVLYRRPPDAYVLHRIIRVLPDGYVTLGDNSIRREPGITDEQIIGVLTEFVHRGRRISVQNFGYRCYAHVWVALWPLRRLFRRGFGWLRNKLRGGEKGERT